MIIMINPFTGLQRMITFKIFAEKVSEFYLNEEVPNFQSEQ